VFRKLIGILKGEYELKYSKEEITKSNKENKTFISLFVLLLIIFFCFGFWVGSQYYQIKVNDIVYNLSQSITDYCKHNLAMDCKYYDGDNMPEACLLIGVD